MPKMNRNSLVEECLRLRGHLQPYSEKFYGSMNESHASNTILPFVLLLGNHSAGKSSFINYLLGRPVQSTGVAPTDDCFTVICPGPEDVDKNGPALVGDPDMGFSSLSYFGETLVNHTQLKIRSDIANKDFMVVDSPGMIDSPAEYDDSSLFSGSSAAHRNNNRISHGGSVELASIHNSDLQQQQQQHKHKRGYDFENVCRWYAERADVILLFFDPDKPGTTGETLSTMVTALAGVDHKLFIIFNKADQFHKMHDFARAYGNLCWNLSKVINRKDMPAIYAMCTPGGKDKSDGPPRIVFGDSGDSVGAGTGNVGLVSPAAGGEERVVNIQSGNASFMEKARDDLDEARNVIMQEIFNCPRRRVDNEISRLTDTVKTLQMHCTVFNKVVTQYRRQLWTSRFIVAGTALLAVGAVVGVGYIFESLNSASPSSGNSANSSSQAAAGTRSAVTSVTAAATAMPTPSLRGAAVTPAVTTTASVAAPGSTLIDSSSVNMDVVQHQQQHGREGATLATVIGTQLNVLLRYIARSKRALMTVTALGGSLSVYLSRKVQTHRLTVKCGILSSYDHLMQVARALYARELTSSPTESSMPISAAEIQAQQSAAAAATSSNSRGGLHDVGDDDDDSGGGVSSFFLSPLRGRRALEAARSGGGGHSNMPGKHDGGGINSSLSSSGTPAARNHFLDAMCSKVVGNLAKRLITDSLHDATPVDKEVFWALDRILLTDVPNLRRRAAVAATSTTTTGSRNNGSIIINNNNNNMNSSAPMHVVNRRTTPTLAPLPPMQAVSLPAPSLSPPSSFSSSSSPAVTINKGAAAAAAAPTAPTAASSREISNSSSISSSSSSSSAVIHNSGASPLISTSMNMVSSGGLTPVSCASSNVSSTSSSPITASAAVIASPYSVGDAAAATATTTPTTSCRSSKLHVSSPTHDCIEDRHHHDGIVVNSQKEPTSSAADGHVGGGGSICSLIGSPPLIIVDTEGDSLCSPHSLPSSTPNYYAAGDASRNSNAFSNDSSVNKKQQQQQQQQQQHYQQREMDSSVSPGLNNLAADINATAGDYDDDCDGAERV